MLPAEARSAGDVTRVMMLENAPPFNPRYLPLPAPGEPAFVIRHSTSPSGIAGLARAASPSVAGRMPNAAPLPSERPSHTIRDGEAPTGRTHRQSRSLSRRRQRMFTPTSPLTKDPAFPGQPALSTRPARWAAVRGARARMRGKRWSISTMQRQPSPGETRIPACDGSGSLSGRDVVEPDLTLRGRARGGDGPHS